MSRFLSKLLIGMFAFALLLFTGSWAQALARPALISPGLATLQQDPNGPNDDNKDQLDDDRNQDVEQDLNEDVNDDKQDLDADHDAINDQIGPNVEELNGDNVEEINGDNNDLDRQIDQKDDFQQDVEDPPVVSLP